MLLGLSSLHLKGLDLLDSVRAAADEGFAWVELWYEQLRDLPMGGASLARELRAIGIGWSVHADMRDLNIASRNAGIRNESLRQILEAIRCAAELEAPFITVHPGHASSSKDVREEYLSAHADSIGELCRAAGSLGLMIALENMEPKPLALATTWAELEELLRSVSSSAIGLTLDIAHMYRLPLDEAELLLERAKPVINAHVSDASERTAHLVLGDGDYDFGGRLRKLALRYSGPVVVEGNDPRLGVSALPRIAAAWRDAISAPP